MQPSTAQHHEVSIAGARVVSDGGAHAAGTTFCCQGCGAHAASLHLYTMLDSTTP